MTDREKQKIIAEYEEYNGWTNYETWVTMLWFDNDKESYKMLRHWVSIYDKLKLEQKIKAFIEENNPLNQQTASLYIDLLGASISKIDFLSIADNLLQEEE